MTKSVRTPDSPFKKLMRRTLRSCKSISAKLESVALDKNSVNHTASVDQATLGPINDQDEDATDKGNNFSMAGKLLTEIITDS